MRLARSGYRPIADYGLIGDCESAALVSSDGSIDWWCPARFDAPSVFGAILDADRGGFFRVHAGEGASSRHAYVEDTNVLRAEFRTGEGAFEVFDFMPIGPARSPKAHILRLVRGLEGRPCVHVEFAPRFDYGAVAPRVERAPDGRILAVGSGQTLALTAPPEVRPVDGGAAGRFDLREGQEVHLALAHRPYVGAGAPSPPALAPRDALESTLRWWRAWAGAHAYDGRWRDRVLRAALALKLLTYEPSGAVVAAPTCSLPEWIGGGRNWDYRYAWVRDAVFAVAALAEVGHAGEAARFVEWIVRNADPDPAKLRVLYSVTGNPIVPERVLPHLHGYKGSRPVRIGNAAEQQFQLDVYGELFAGAHAAGILDRVDPEGETWAWFRRLADFVADRWRSPDSGIWEMRSGPRHYVLSKAMAWAALDRAARVAERGGLPGDRARWRREADACRAEALEKGFDEDLGAFRQSYEVAALDASNLLLPVIGFVEPRDPRMLGTLDATLADLTSDGLVYRYLDVDDGVGGPEATFVYCSFWLVEALALAGRVEEAERVFQGLLDRATPLGLYAEEIDAETGEHLGNFPQGFPHMGLIRAARVLETASRAAEARTRAATPPRPRPSAGS